MSEFPGEVTTAAAQAESSLTAGETKVITAYKAAGQIRSASAQKAFLERFLPQMETQLGLVNFVSDDVKDIIRQDPARATDIVSLMKDAQRKMKEEIEAKKAFRVSDEPRYEGRSDTSPLQPKEATSYNYKVNAALRAIKARIKDLNRLRMNPQAVEMLSAILSDDFNDAEIQEVLFLLGVR